MEVRIVPTSLSDQPRSLIIIGAHMDVILITTEAPIITTKAMVTNSETCGWLRHRDIARMTPTNQTMTTGMSVVREISVGTTYSMRQTSFCECVKRQSN